MILKIISGICGIYLRIEVTCSAPMQYCIEVLVSDFSYVICELFTVTHKHTLMWHPHPRWLHDKHSLSWLMQRCRFQSPPPFGPESRLLGQPANEKSPFCHNRKYLNFAIKLCQEQHWTRCWCWVAAVWPTDRSNYSTIDPSCFSIVRNANTHKETHTSPRVHGAAVTARCWAHLCIHLYLQSVSSCLSDALPDGCYKWKQLLRHVWMRRAWACLIWIMHTASSFLFSFFYCLACLCTCLRVTRLLTCGNHPPCA